MAIARPLLMRCRSAAEYQVLPVFELFSESMAMTDNLATSISPSWGMLRQVPGV